MGPRAAPAPGIALLILLAAGSVPAAPAGEQEFHGKRILLAEPPHSQLAAGHPVHRLGKELCVGGATFPLAGEGARLRVATEPGLAPSIEIAPGKPVHLAWTAGGAKRTVLLSFARDEGGAWTWWASEAVKFKIAGEDFRLYDGDGDGSYADFAKDGWSTGDTDQVVPLAKEILLGPNLVVLRSIDPEGGRVIAETSPLPGTASQVAGLVLANRLRAANGLPPAMLDGKLSAACTAHADYLAANGWKGTTSPHAQDLGPKGASPEGAAAAARSDIQFDPPDVAIRTFWRTYYHRIGFMGPALDLVGVNAEPPNIAVVDIARGYGEGVTVPKVGLIRELTFGEWPWTDPVFVPADGLTGFPLAAAPEMPKGPVADFGSRGAPLMALFRGFSRVTHFQGTLEELTKKGPERVAVLPGDSTFYPFAYGIVPAAPLHARATYRAVFTWHSVDEDSDFRRTIRFTTE